MSLDGFEITRTGRIEQGQIEKIACRIIQQLKNRDAKILPFLRKIDGSKGFFDKISYAILAKQESDEAIACFVEAFATVFKYNQKALEAILSEYSQILLLRQIRKSLDGQGNSMSEQEYFIKEGEALMKQVLENAKNLPNK